MLKSIHLDSFRSYSKNSFDLNSQTIIISGPNTSGKTNILEAIFLGATGKSFRTPSDQETIKHEKDYARVELLVDDETELEILLTRGNLYGRKVASKKYFVNKIPRRAIDFAGRFKVSLFWPEDLALIINSPSTRRRYLDFVLSQTDREYHRNLRLYEKGVRARNRLLYKIKEGEATPDQLPYWDDLIINSGSYLSKQREEFINFINLNEDPIKNKSFSIVYDHSKISKERLKQYEKEEVMATNTLVGPHRDDLKFEIRNSKFEIKRNLAHFGSRGEQRLGVLWLKLNELLYIEKKTGSKPILLLDDIFSELDKDNRHMIFSIVKNHQTIITTAELDLVDRKFLKEAKVIKLT
ncbi:DNA replication/repair protein RecF [Candidatus Gottesmanbacteria bacterium]|nr:DNA replication/repair protein RecF [Candidatus Gottesmanbacteria bacterium]